MIGTARVTEFPSTPVHFWPVGKSLSALYLKNYQFFGGMLLNKSCLEYHFIPLYQFSDRLKKKKILSKIFPSPKPQKRIYRKKLNFKKFYVQHIGFHILIFHYFSSSIRICNKKGAQKSEEGGSVNR